MCLRTMRPGLGNVSYGFAGTIVPDDERERLVELDDVGIVRTEAPNALYQHLHDTVMPIRLLRLSNMIFAQRNIECIQGP